MADRGRPGRHFGNRHCVWVLRPLRRGWTSARPHSSIYRHSASRPRGSLVSLGLWSNRSPPSRLWTYHSGRARCIWFVSPGYPSSRALAAQPILQDAPTGGSVLRRRLSEATEDEFSLLPDYRAPVVAVAGGHYKVTGPLTALAIPTSLFSDDGMQRLSTRRPR
jgi:hypothetical protein